jgi:hypothetical protein
MKAFLRWFATLVLALVVIVGADSIPALKRIDTITDLHRRTLVAITLSITILGWLIFMGSVIYFSVKDGRPLTTEEVEETAKQVKYRNASFSTYRFRGKTWGKGFEDSFSFAEAKRAGKGWWKDPRWRRNFVVGGGALTMGFGLFGLLGVLGPVGIKVLLAGTTLYAAVRLVWAFMRA